MTPPANTAWTRATSCPLPPSGPPCATATWPGWPTTTPPAPLRACRSRGPKPRWARWQLVGRLDRVDRAADGQTLVIDYKTEGRSAHRGSHQGRGRRHPAGLLRRAAARRQPARRLPERGRARRHPSCMNRPTSPPCATACWTASSSDLQRIADGAPLPALGEGSACDWCARAACAARTAGPCPPRRPGRQQHERRRAVPRREGPLGGQRATRSGRAWGLLHHQWADPATREAFYAIACDPRRSVAVEACAGAGKTWMLVSRIVRALLDGAEPHEILAITFTKKAAGEMRQRLQEWLAAFAAEPEPAQARPGADCTRNGPLPSVKRC
jgi:hypothetical protein